MIWPDYGAEFRVHANLADLVSIPQRREDPLEAELACQVHEALCAVLEFELPGDISRSVWRKRCLSAYLLQWRNGLEFAGGLREIPVCFEFVMVQRSPLRDQAQCAWRQAAAKDS